MDGRSSILALAGRFAWSSGSEDRLIPWQQTERQAAEAPNGTFMLYDGGAHGNSNVPYRNRPLIEDWLAEHLR